MQLLQAYLISHINEPKTIMRPERKCWGGGQGGDISLPAQEWDPGGQPEYVGL